MRAVLDPIRFPDGHHEHVQGIVHQIGPYAFDDSVILNRSLWEHLSRISLAPLRRGNLLVVGGMYSGKTLLLLRCLENLLNTGYSVLLVDVCVEEGGVSLINILQTGGIPKTVIMSAPKESAAILTNNELRNLVCTLRAESADLWDYFPRLDLLDDPLWLIDLSWYLERSHDAQSERERQQLYRIHCDLVTQVIVKARYYASRFKRPVAMLLDEVRLPRQVLWAFETYPAPDFRLVSAVHRREYMSDAMSLFQHGIELGDLAAEEPGIHLMASG